MKVFLILIIGTLAGFASAQQSEDPMVASMMAGATRPGDDALTCEQIEAEITALGTDPQVKSVLEEEGAYAQGQLAKVSDAKSKSGVKPAFLGQMFMGMLTTILPNPVSGYTQQAAAAAQNAKAQAEAEKNQERMLASVEKIVGIMPQIMRGAQVTRLAEAKGCEFMADAAPTK